MSGMKEQKYESVLSRMAGVCARSEQCEFDIRKKLSRYVGITQEEKERIILYLKENSFLDDRRFACAFARDKSRFVGWGVRKIRPALLMKHIDFEFIEEALSGIDKEDMAMAVQKLVEVKSRRFNLNDYNDRMKVYRSLAARGFTTREIGDALREVVKRMEGAD
jgi:regulatory protein